MFGYVNHINIAKSVNVTWLNLDDLAEPDKLIHRLET